MSEGGNVSDDGARHKRISRRAVLLASAAGVSAVAVARLLRSSFARPAAPLPSPATVALIGCETYRTSDLRRAL